MPTTNTHFRTNALLISILIFILIFAAGWYTINNYDTLQEQQQQTFLKKELLAKSSALSQIINHRFALLYGVRAFVLTHFEQLDGTEHNFNPNFTNVFLKEIYTTVPDIYSVTISPKGIHKYIYPLTESTKKTLGHNLLTDKRPHVRKKVQQTIGNKTIGLSGPYPLRQDGNLGLIARLPIYQDNKFWGLTVMVLNVPKMLAVGDLEPTGNFALRMAGGIVFYGDPKIFDKDPLLSKVILPDGQWELARRVDTLGLATSVKVLLFILNSIFAFLISSLCFFFYTKNWYLQSEVEKATKELSLERDNLNSIFAAMEDGVYIVDHKFDIQFVNRVLTKEFGPYEGKKCYEYFHNRVEVCPWCKNDKVLKGETVHWEWYSSQTEMTYDLIDTPLKSPDGSILKLEIFRDITERKNTEQQLRRMSRAIEKSVNEVYIFDSKTLHFIDYCFLI